MTEFKEILSFWFERSAKFWFGKNEEFDREIRDRFLTTYQQAAAGNLDFWQELPQSCLALIVILDQFPRNMFRDSPQAFATDDLALKHAKNAVNNQFDRQIIPRRRKFMYMPFMHSENIADQKRSLDLFTSLKNDPDSKEGIYSAQKHYQIIKRFDRFPHRNQILGRESTPAEIEFLQTPSSSF